MLLWGRMENLSGRSDIRVPVSHRELNLGKLLKIPQDRAAFLSPPKKTVGRRDDKHHGR